MKKAAPVFEVKVSEVENTIRSMFLKSGSMKPVGVQAALDEADAGVEAYKKVYAKYLKENWDEMFPGVEYSDELLDKKLDEVLEEKRAEYEHKVMKHFQDRKGLVVMGNYLFKKATVWFYGCAIASLITFPIGVTLFTSNSNIGLLIGLLLLLGTFGALGVTFAKLNRAEV